MITVPKLLILLAIIMVVFGTKKLRGIGTDLGEAIRGFRNALKEGEGEGEKVADSQAVENETVNKTDDKA